jgi:hypothetical protein
MVMFAPSWFQTQCNDSFSDVPGDEIHLGFVFRGTGKSWTSVARPSRARPVRSVSSS